MKKHLPMVPQNKEVHHHFELLEDIESFFNLSEEERAKIDAEQLAEIEDLYVLVPIEREEYD